MKALFEDTVKVTPKKQKLWTKWAKVEEQLLAGQKNVLIDPMKVMIDEFLCHSDITYTVSGRNNQLCMGKVNGKSQFSPKQYLSWTFQELHSLIIKEAGMEGIKFSSLYCYRKSKGYTQVSKIPEVSCLCPDCENIELLCVGIKHAYVLKQTCHQIVMSL